LAVFLRPSVADTPGDEWLSDAYVPRSDDLSRQTILGTTAFCSDAGQDPGLNERAVRLLARVVDAAPRNGGTEMDRAVCKALMDLSNLYTIGGTATDGRRRTQASIDVCDEIIARWETSRDNWLRLNVAGAMLGASPDIGPALLESKRGELVIIDLHGWKYKPTLGVTDKNGAISSATPSGSTWQGALNSSTSPPGRSRRSDHLPASDEDRLITANVITLR
jgi:hypothetical protein